MTRRIAHEELKGGYTLGKKIIIDAVEVFGEFEVMAMYESGEEIESWTAATEEEALDTFNRLFSEYAEPMQKALYGRLTVGEKYTIVFLNDFGFPVAEKNNISFHVLHDIRTA